MPIFLQRIGAAVRRGFRRFVEFIAPPPPPPPPPLPPPRNPEDAARIIFDSMPPELKLEAEEVNERGFIPGKPFMSEELMDFIQDRAEELGFPPHQIYRGFYENDFGESG